MDAFNKLSVPILETYRSQTLNVNVVLTILSLTLLIVAVSSYSENSAQIETAAWTIQLDRNNNIFAYYGIRAFSTTGSKDTTTFKSCASANNACKQCETAGEFAARGIALACIYIAIMGLISFQRLHRSPATPATAAIAATGSGRGDYGFRKVAAVLTSALALVIIAECIISWNSKCVNHLSTSDGFTYKWGPGLISVVVAFLLTMFVFFTHLLLAAEDNNQTLVSVVETVVVSGTAV